MTYPASPPRPKRKGNYKPGPGRPPGRKNNKTLALEEAARQAAAQIDGAFEGDAHQFLQWVYKNPDFPIEVRIQAAGRALRVEKPTLSASQNTVDVNVDIAARMDAARARLAEHRAAAVPDGRGGDVSAADVVVDQAATDRGDGPNRG